MFIQLSYLTIITIIHGILGSFLRQTMENTFFDKKRQDLNFRNFGLAPSPSITKDFKYQALNTHFKK